MNRNQTNLDRALELYNQNHVLQYFLQRDFSGHSEYTFKKFILSLGLREYELERFVQNLIYQDRNVDHLARLLDIDISKLEPRLNGPQSLDINHLLANGDLVILKDYHEDDENIYGEKYFVTGLDKTNGHFVFISVNNVTGHMDMARLAVEKHHVVDNHADLEIIEGGFMRIQFGHKNIELRGSSNTFHVHAGLVSKFLLQRALPEWNVDIH